MLSKDHAHSVLVDSTYRNRTQSPYPAEFILNFKTGIQNAPNDPVGVGYILYSDTVAAYTSGSPDYVTLVAGIPVTFFENRLLQQYVEIISAGGVVRGASQVAGFTSGSPIMDIYLTRPIAGVVATDVIIIRQFAPSAKFQFTTTANTPIGSMSVPIVGGPSAADAFKGNYLLDITTPNSKPYLITASIAGTLTISRGLLQAIPIGVAVEIYDVKDNETGLSQMGSIANQSSPTNYEIKMDWIRIPKHPLYVNEVGVTPSLPITVSSYAYLMVEFHNINGGSLGVIQSNNLNSRKAQFIIPIEDLSTTVGKFYTLRAPNTIVTKFSPAEPIYFSVVLPSGQPLRFDPDDEVASSLTVPNPDMQISAHFSLRRVVI